MRKRTVRMRNLLRCSSHDGWRAAARTTEPVCRDAPSRHTGASRSFESSAHRRVQEDERVAAVPVDLQHRGQAVDHAVRCQEVGHVELGTVHQQLRGESRRSGGEERREREVRRRGEERAGGQDGEERRGENSRSGGQGVRS